MKLLVMLIFALAPNATGVQRSPDEIAEMMATIADPPWGERARVQRRFAYLLPRYVAACADLRTEIDAADVSVHAFQVIGEAGLDEDLLELTEGVYGVLRHAQVLGLLGEGGCREYFAMYITMRQEGMSPADATDGIKGILNAFR